ncbi:MAG: nuclear transport factor 2 family protein [Hyphomicrobiaceae bacterium]
MTQPEISKVTQADEAHSFAEYNAISDAVQIYIDGAKAGDSSLMREAFYDHAHIVGTINGEYSSADITAFAQSVASIGPSPNLQSRIASIDVSGPAASAKVEFTNWAGFRFTDFFVLYKHAGKWKISSKVYDSHAHN